jgi:TolB protein
MDSHRGHALGVLGRTADFSQLRWLICAGATAAVAAAVAGGLGKPASAAQSSRADGATRIPVSGLGGSLQNPCFSPDGTQIALTRWPRRYNEGIASVHVADVASGDVLARLTPRGATGVNLPGSCWNATTDRIVFSLERNAPDWPYSASPDGQDLRRLVRRRGKVAIEPSFAPDGRRIAFEVSKYDAEGDGSIFLANVDGTGVRRLTRNSDDRQPNWSPTGHRIVFQRRRGEVWDAWTIQPDGTGLRNETRTQRFSETDIAWAPDGERIVFSSDEHRGQVAALVVMDVDGGERTRVTRARGWYDGAPSWSHDGTTIAFEARRGDPDGSAGTRLYRIAAP